MIKKAGQGAKKIGGAAAKGMGKAAQAATTKAAQTAQRGVASVKKGTAAAAKELGSLMLSIVFPAAALDLTCKKARPLLDKHPATPML